MQAELLGFLQASAPPRLSDGLEHRFEENPWRGVGRCMYNGFLKTHALSDDLIVGTPGASVQSGAERAGSRMHRVARARRR